MKISRDKRAEYLLLAAAGLFATIVFVVDLVTPPQVDVWVFYLPVILAPVLFNNVRQILIAAIVCSALAVVGFFVSPLGLSEWTDILNRGMDLLALWMTAFAAMTIARRSVQLAAAMEGLRRETLEHDLAKQALAQSEGRLRLAIEGAHMGTWDMNLRTGKGIWSETQFRMFGYAPTPKGEVTIDMWENCIHPEDRSYVLKNRDLAKQEQSLLRDEYRIIRADTGQIAWMAAFGRFLTDESGEGVRNVGVSFDITHRKKLEREVLEIAEREQWRIGQELHDSVGQELTGLGLMADALHQKLDGKAPHDQIAARLSEGIDRVHQQIRTLSRGLVPVLVEAKGLWAALDDLATTTSKQTGISITFDSPQRCEVANHNRAMELFRIAQEAVSNALRHGKPDHVRLSLLSGEHNLRLCIQDDGVGMPTRPAESTGMGLRIMEYRAQQIGGTLQIAPAQGGGTVVTCLIGGNNGNGNSKLGSKHYVDHGENSYRG
jgi:PAS domain S-box-containing protein